MNSKILLNIGLIDVECILIGFLVCVAAGKSHSHVQTGEGLP